MPYVRRTKRRPSVSRRLKVIAFGCAVLAVVLIFAGLFMRQQEVLAQNAAEAASYTPAPLPVAVDEPVAAFLGDSFTAGTNFGGIKQEGWPAIVSERHDWVRSMHAVGGTGFVNGIDTGVHFGARVDEVIAAEPDVVIVAGGGNDYRQDPARVREEMATVLTQLQEGLPDAEVVLIAPLWLQQEDPDTLEALRTVTAEVASATGVTRIDPAGWLRGRPELLGEDKVHPTDEGHEVLADLVDAALIKSGAELP